MGNRDVVLCAPMRTAIGTFGGSLKDVPATELGAVAIRACLARAGLPADRVQSVVMGNVIQAGNRMGPARQAALAAGVPVAAPAMTVNRVCGSGAQAIVSIAQEIRQGDIDCGIAGGLESMERAPYLLAGGRFGYRLGDGQVLDSMLLDGLHEPSSGRHAGWHTDAIARELGIGREAQDAFALRSQRRFAAAQASFEAEIAPIEVEGRKGTTVFAKDEHNRPDTTMESLARLRPAFREDGTITAGSAPGLNSGAAAMVVCERRFAERAGLEPAARLVAHAVAALEPERFPLAPVPAVRMALERAGWSQAEVDRYEINEAFAAVVIAILRELGLPEDVVNVEGGAIAHGHPIGATGAVLTTRLLHQMRRAGLRRGVVTLCIGGGMGIALALEAV
jgi:acetyl-CoA C-acetyltransferase